MCVCIKTLTLRTIIMFVKLNIELKCIITITTGGETAIQF